MPSFQHKIYVSPPSGIGSDHGNYVGPAMLFVMTGTSSSAVSAANWGSTKSVYHIPVSSEYSLPTTVYLTVTATTVYASYRVLVPYVQLSDVDVWSAALSSSSTRSCYFHMYNFSSDDILTNEQWKKRCVIETYLTNLNIVGNSRGPSTTNSINVDANGSYVPCSATGYSNLKFTGTGNELISCEKLLFSGHSAELTYTPIYTLNLSALSNIRVINNLSVTVYFQYFYIRKYQTSTNLVTLNGNNQYFTNGSTSYLQYTLNQTSATGGVSYYIVFYFSSAPGTFKVTIQGNNTTGLPSYTQNFGGVSSATLDADVLLTADASLMRFDITFANS